LPTLRERVYGNGMNLLAAKNVLVNADWIYAKSMPKFPHWYTLRETWSDDPLFDEVVAFIRKHGRRERFGRKQFIYFYLDGHKYWTMGAPIPDTILINRAAAPGRTRTH